MSDPTFLPLNLKNVGLDIGEKTCLSDISFSIENSGITVIMGSNGSGKTLLLKLCAGLLTPSHGSINWQELPQPPQITLVPPHAVLLNRTVIDNIQLPLSYHRRANIIERSRQALEWAGISHIGKQVATTLSTGQQQLVALARAWALEPNILLLDELTANLDPTRRQEIDMLIQQLSESCKIFISTHSIQQAKKLASDILLLDDGKLRIHSVAESFFDSAEFKRFSEI